MDIADRDRWRAWSRQHEAKLFLFVTLVIGALVGVVITAFVLVTQQVTLKLYPRGGEPWQRLVVPVTGALVTGYLLERYFPNARGRGNESGTFCAERADPAAHHCR